MVQNPALFIVIPGVVQNTHSQKEISLVLPITYKGHWDWRKIYYYGIMLPKVFRDKWSRVSQNPYEVFDCLLIKDFSLLLFGQKLRIFHSKARSQKLNSASIYFPTAILPQLAVYICLTISDKGIQMPSTSISEQEKTFQTWQDTACYIRTLKEDHG